MAAVDHPLGALALPGSTPAPGVVMIPDVWGLSDHYRELGERLAGEGFAVLVLDPYRKTGQPELTDVASAMAWIRGLSDPLLLETIQEAVDALAARSDVGRVGVVGFCMGGQYALLAACGCQGLSACVPFYGMLRYEEGLAPERKPRSPLEALGDLGCPVLGLYGAEDAIIPAADVEALEAGLAGSGQPHEVHVYAGAGHAFMNTTRPEMHRPEAAQDAWARLVPFLRRHLA